MRLALLQYLTLQNARDYLSKVLIHPAIGLKSFLPTTLEQSHSADAGIFP